MIEHVLCEHLKNQPELAECLTTYAERPAVFNQSAPDDQDAFWGSGPQYGRVVFAVDLQGDTERTMGGMLIVDIMCKEAENSEDPLPEDIEPILRSLIHGYFFTDKGFTVAAQWKNSNYFTQATDQVIGCTLAFELLAFPIITTTTLDVVARFNEWSSHFENLHVINYGELPAAAWKPSGNESAVYWRFLTEAPANWIPDTYQTIWRTATIKGHIFSETPAVATSVARDLTVQLYAVKRLRKDGESPIMVNRRNTTDIGADPLRTGQVTVEATFGIIVSRGTGETIQKINY